MAKALAVAPKREVVKIHVKFTLNTPDGLRRVIFDLEKDTADDGAVSWKITFQLFERDKKGILKKRMMECVDGEYQTYKANNGAYVREHFFGKSVEQGGDAFARVFEGLPSLTAEAMAASRVAGAIAPIRMHRVLTPSNWQDCRAKLFSPPLPCC